MPGHLAGMTGRCRYRGRKGIKVGGGHRWSWVVLNPRGLLDIPRASPADSRVNVSGPRGEGRRRSESVAQSRRGPE